jgi:hypothetical protein
MSRSHWEMIAVLSIAAAIIGWQLFVPPIIGLADQGDFVLLLGPLGYAPQPKGPEHKYWYLTRTFVWDPSYREPRWDQPSSEIVPAKAAVFLNRIFGDPRKFDLTLFGFTHAALFLIAFARLLYVTRRLVLYRLIWWIALLVLTDVGYVAYWNSLYREPASGLWLLFLLAESIAFCGGHSLSIGAALRWNVFAILFITAKVQNVPLGLPLAAYGLTMAWHATARAPRWIAATGAVAILASGALLYSSRLPAPAVTNLYNVVFFGILPDSNDPASDLRALGLDPAYAKYSGTLAWTEGTGVGDGYLVNALQQKVSSIKLALFYLARPARLWKRAETELHVALSLRPEFCGNFDQSAGRFPGARSHAIAFWSYFHERWLSPIGAALLAGLLLAPIGGIVLLWTKRVAKQVRPWAELAICLSVCCLMAFAAAAFGDTWDSVKHLYIFNLLLDICLVFAVVAMCCGAFVAHRSVAPSEH